MSERRMSEERKITFSKRCSAHLHGYRLKFNKVAQHNSSEGKANIVPDSSALVEGALYDMEMTFLPTLDECEGYPEHYLKIPVKVSFLNSGKRVCAITYVAHPNKIAEDLKPTKKYLAYLLEGKDLLSPEYYEHLKETDTLDL